MVSHPEQSAGFSVLYSGSDAFNASSLEPGHVVASNPPVASVEARASSAVPPLSDTELGVAVGGVFLLVVLLAVLFVGTKRRQRMQETQTSPRSLESGVEQSGRSSGDAQELYILEGSCVSQSPASSPPRVPTLGELDEVEPQPTYNSWAHPDIVAMRIKVNEISLNELVARGTNSEVYRGQYRDQFVAIKKPLPQWLQDRRNVDLFFARAWRMASPALTHQGIVALLGVSWSSLVYVCMVSEFMAGGDLLSLLGRHAQQSSSELQIFERRGFCRVKVCIASQLASALSFLHDKGLVHGAVRSRNVLLDDQLNAKLNGFVGTNSEDHAVDAVNGTRRHSHESPAQVMPTRARTTSIGVGVRMGTRPRQRARHPPDGLWSAPEVLRGGRCSSRADIFSLGVVLSELDSSALPYAQTSRPNLALDSQDDSTTILDKVAAGRLRVRFVSSRRGRCARRGSATPALAGPNPQVPVMHGAATAAMVRLGKACVALDPRVRPTASQVSKELHKLLQALEPTQSAVQVL